MDVVEKQSKLDAMAEQLKEAKQKLSEQPDVEALTDQLSVAKLQSDKDRAEIERLNQMLQRRDAPNWKRNAAMAWRQR